MAAMRRWRAGAWFLATQLVLGCVWAGTTTQPTNAIPSHQPPLSRTFPPAPEEQTSPGTGKFVIFTREGFGNPLVWDFVAGAWECIPSRPRMPLTKRLEFCHSSWEASTLLDCLVKDKRNQDQYPRFVRLQVDAGDRDYAVNLYDVDYRTWTARCVWQGTRLSAFGALKDAVICRSSNDWFSLDAVTGTITKQIPFIPIDVDGGYWIVRKHGETSGNWSYDPLKDTFAGHFLDVEHPEAGCVRSQLSPDGRNRAWLLAPWRRDWRGGTLDGTFLLQRDGQPTDLRVPVVFQARMGSGVPVIPTGIRLQFTAEGGVEFAAQLAKPKTQERVWTIEIATGNVVETTRPHREPAEDRAMFDGVPAPEYLRGYLKNLWHFGREALAPAFLQHMGILKQPPEFPDCTAGVSRDGRHILYKAKNGPLAKVFIYGDLQTKQVLRWATPEALQHDNAMEFVWVETP